MFYKNSQNYKVQSLLSSYSGEPQVIRADSSGRAGGGCRGCWQRLLQLILVCGPRNSCTIKDSSPAASVLP